jgi:hypothetical protein
MLFIYYTLVSIIVSLPPRSRFWDSFARVAQGKVNPANTEQVAHRLDFRRVIKKSIAKQAATFVNTRIRNTALAKTNARITGNPQTPYSY